MTRSVAVGGLTFGVPAVVDAGGSRWTLTSIDGWDNSGSGVRRDSADRPQQHGVFAAPGFRTGRLVAFGGLVECPSRAVAAGVKSALAALLADGSDGDLTVVDVDEPTMSASVGLATLPVIDWTGGLEVECAFELWAPDPLRYAAPVVVATGFAQMLGGLAFDLFTDGTTVTGLLEYGDPGAETGMVDVTNAGNAPAWPVFTVTGPTPAFDILVEGERLRFSAALSTGQTLVIDTKAGTVLLDGVDRRVSLTIREWRAVAKGETATVVFTPLAGPTSGQLSVSLASPFW